MREMIKIFHSKYHTCGDSDPRSLFEKDNKMKKEMREIKKKIPKKNDKYNATL